MARSANMVKSTDLVRSGDLGHTGGPGGGAKIAEIGTKWPKKVPFNNSPIRDKIGHFLPNFCPIFATFLPLFCHFLPQFRPFFATFLPHLGQKSATFRAQKVPL
jgi:hypothetical protein